MAKFLVIAALLAFAWYYLRRPAPAPRIDEAEARAILGVGASADAEAIRAAHRRLVAAVHPDRGGSADLARRINAARDVLLKRG
jgi:DnaJ homolog subfamily C member 19